MAIRIELGGLAHFADLAETWRALEARSPNASFFQGWTWMGCLAQERFCRPVIVRAEADGVLVGLALFNRTRGGLHLSETGTARLDAPFVEHNAPLVAADATPDVLPAIMRAAWRAGAVWYMNLAGVPPVVASSAGGWTWRHQAREAPRVEFAPIRAAGRGYLAALSANTRQQIRRSLRAFAVHGEVRLERATTTEEALAWFGDLTRLHGATWRKRGMPGAFADSFMLHFHRSLITRGMPRGEVDLLRAHAGSTIIGYLYNLRRGGSICTYQGGWGLAGMSRDERPGIVCHVLAIEDALRSGASHYDFLAGEDRYKRDLSNGATTLLWLRRLRVPG